MQNNEKAIEWLEEEFNKKWRRFGAKETMVWYGQEITYFSCWHGIPAEDEMGNLRYRNPGTMMKIKEDDYGLYYEPIEETNEGLAEGWAWVNE